MPAKTHVSVPDGDMTSDGRDSQCTALIPATGDGLAAVQDRHAGVDERQILFRKDPVDHRLEVMIEGLNRGAGIAST